MFASFQLCLCLCHPTDVLVNCVTLLHWKHFIICLHWLFQSVKYDYIIGGQVPKFYLRGKSRRALKLCIINAIYKCTKSND